MLGQETVDEEAGGTNGDDEEIALPRCRYEVGLRQRNQGGDEVALSLSITLVRRAFRCHNSPARNMALATPTSQEREESQPIDMFVSLLFFPAKTGSRTRHITGELLDARRGEFGCPTTRCQPGSPSSWTMISHTGIDRQPSARSTGFAEHVSRDNHYLQRADADAPTSPQG